MSTDQIKNFLVLSRVLNFRKATETIYIAQPALSRQIQQLEREIGAALFDRSKKQIRLTDAGVYFRQEAQRLMDQLEQAKRRCVQIDKGEAGEVTIGHVSSAMQSVIPEFLKKIKHTLPALKISLLEGTNRLIFDRIVDRQLDFGIVPNAIAPATIHGSVIYRENFVVIMPGSYKLKKGSRGLSAFATANWILPQQGEGLGYSDILYRMFQQCGFRPNVVFESPNASTSLRLVSAGLGVTIIGKSALNGVALDIKHIELSNINEKIEMKLVWLGERERELERYIPMFQKFLAKG